MRFTGFDFIVWLDDPFEDEMHPTAILDSTIFNFGKPREARRIKRSIHCPKRRIPVARKFFARAL
jgi:hypothetical protein